jgi:hypothetical protein
MSLENYAIMRRALPRRTSSYDRTGGNIDCLTDIAPGAAVVLLDTEGPGKITHLWITMMEFPGHETLLRDMVLRIFWEGSTVPSVEVPVGDFFGLGHALTPQFYERRKFELVSEPLTVGSSERALNCYWPMPFRRSARIEIYNNGAASCRLLYYHVDYELGEQPADAGLFHANFRQDPARHGQAPNDDYQNLDGRDNFVLMETEGRGHYAGCFFYIDTDAGGWWGEGDDMIFIDHSPLPVIYGTGSEDYFCNAWGFKSPFSYPYFGAPLLDKRPDGGEFTTVYRFHIPDPIHFQEHIKVTLECWWETHRTNAIASVAFWYQDKPIAAREPLPAGAANHPRSHPLVAEDRWVHGPPADPRTTYIRPPMLEGSLRREGIQLRTISRVGQTFIYGDGSNGALALESNGREIAIPCVVPADGRYRVDFKPVYGELSGPMHARLGDTTREIAPQKFESEDRGPFIQLGEIESSGKTITLHVSGDPVATLHGIRLTLLSGV